MATTKPQPIQLRDEEAEKALSAYVLQSIDQAEADRRQYIANVKANRLLLQCVDPRTAKPWATACELVVPLGKYYHYALCARLSRAICGVTPLANVEARTGDARQLAPFVETFLELQTDQLMHLRGTVDRLIDVADADGVSVAYVWWRSDTRKRIRWQQTEGKTWTKTAADELIYDGPEVTCVAIEDVGTWPANANDFQAAVGAYLFLSVTGDDILARLAAGDYDEDAVAELRKVAGDIEAGRTSDATARDISQASGPDAPEFRTRPYQLSECYCRIDPTLLSGEGQASEDAVAIDVLVTIHRGSGIILRCVPNPWGHGLRPLVAFRPRRDRFGIIGDSIMDIVGDSQKAMTALLRLGIDGMAKAIDPPLAVDQTMPDHLKREIQQRRGPGGIIFLPPAWFDKVKPWIHATIPPQMILGLTEDVRLMSERASFISDARLGAFQSKAMTAKEFQQTLSEGDEPLALMVDRMSDPVSDLVRFIKELDYERWTSDSVQGLWALSVGDNPEAPEAVDALAIDYAINAAGTTETSNRAMGMEKAEKVYAEVSQNPLTTPEQAFAARTQLYNAWGVRNPETYIGDEESFKARIEEMKAQAAQEAQMQQNQAMQQQQAQGTEAQAGREHDMQVEQMKQAGAQQTAAMKQAAPA